MSEYGIKELTLSDEENDYLLVAAIDFGTTYSGYAFSFRTNSREVYMNKNWGGAQGQACFKTPTCVLVNGNNKFVSFGFEAESKYADYEADEAQNKTQQLHLFRHFKMALFKKTNVEKLSKSMSIEAVDGHVCPAYDIFTMALAYLKDHLLEAVKVSSGKAISASAVKWVLTVPAIWTDDAKQFMRGTALEAGLINIRASKKLLVALEPEAASIFCRSLNTSEFKKSGGTTKLETKKGTKYFVVDAGGGTIDITAHEILADGAVKEVLPPSGGDWGGTQVDQNFMNILGDVLGTEFLKCFRLKDPTNWMSMMLSFQTVKCSASADAGSLKLQIPAYNMDSLCREVNKQPLDKLINGKQDKTGVKFSNGFLILNKSCIDRLFTSVIGEIIQHFQSLARSTKMSPCSYVFLVGGFGNSSILFDKLKSSTRVPVLVPPDPQIAIVKGAVMFGHNSDVISSRIARRTYGLSVAKPREDWHRTDKIYADDDGNEFCGGFFDVLLEINEEVSIGAVKTFTRIPLKKDNVSSHASLIASDLPSSDFTYIDDPGVETVGEITVMLPPVQNLKSSNDRSIKYNVTFGGTEIRIHVTDVLTGSFDETAIDFMAE